MVPSNLASSAEHPILMLTMTIYHLFPSKTPNHLLPILLDLWKINHSLALVDRHYDILAQGLIGLIEYSYHQGIPSFPEAHLQRTLRLSVLGPEQFQDG
jgi:hypothetical protein